MVGDDQARIIVLQIGQQFLHMLFVMIVNQRHGAGYLPAPPLLPVLDESGANQISDGQGAVVVPLLLASGRRI